MFKKWPQLLPMLLALLIFDCQCQKERFVVKNVLLDLPTNQPAFSQNLDREKFAEVVKDTLSKDKHFFFDRDSKLEQSLRVQVIMAEPDPRSLLVAGILTRRQGEEESHLVNAFADIEIRDAQVSGANIRQGMNELLANLYGAMHINTLKASDYLPKLERAAAGEAYLLGDAINALYVLAELKELKALPFMLKLLRTTTNLSLGAACVISLGELGDEKALPDIFEYTERKSSLIRRQAIVAARKIASIESLGWLYTMAYGYNDEIVNHEAMEAYNEVLAKLVKEGKVAPEG